VRDYNLPRFHGISRRIGVYSGAREIALPEFFKVGGFRGYIFQGVYFTEGRPEGAQVLEQIETTSNVQNTNLDWLREQLAKQVKRLGGNALIGFTYVQKANVFSFSSITWKASGTAATIENLEAFKEDIQQAGPSAKKNCPFCGEEVLSVATKCKHCKEDI
jgi:hypothetical protein